MKLVIFPHLLHYFPKLYQDLSVYRCWQLCMLVLYPTCDANSVEVIEVAVIASHRCVDQEREHRAHTLLNPVVRSCPKQVDQLVCGMIINAV